MISRISVRNMSQTIVRKLCSNAETAEKRLEELRSKLEEIKKIKLEEKIKDLVKENSLLSLKVDQAKSELIQLENSHGKIQYPLPGRQEITLKVTAQLPVQNTNTAKQPIKKDKKEKDCDNKKVKEKLSNDTTETPVDVRKLDFRIGKIVDINKHPDADTLYVEKIDCGEPNPRTVVSGLVKHVPIDEMRDRIVMVLCNLKPVKMRGVMSEAMVMCASTPDKVEVLVPPSTAVPGDLVSCEGYPREPEAILNPKKKIFETCAIDLKTNDDKIACYKRSPLLVPGKGPITASTLKGVQVK